MLKWNSLGNRIIDAYNSCVTLVIHAVGSIAFVAWYTGHLKIINMTEHMWVITVH